MANKELWTEYNGKGFGAEYADYAVRATKDEDGNVIADTYATKDAMIGATEQSDGVAGLVPAPLIADKDKFLKGDGTWAEVGSGLPDPTESDSLLLGQSDGSKAWNALSRDVMGTPLLDESNRPILDENSNPVYDANSTTDLWTSFAGHEFGAKRAYADQEGNNIKATYVTKDDLDVALGNIETLLAAI